MDRQTDSGSGCPVVGAESKSHEAVRLYLFDVDGTLVSARGAGRRALGAALRETFGTAGAIDVYDFRGKTDSRIVLDLMAAAGVPVETVRARLGACFDTYLRRLEEALGDGSAVDVMPGVAALVHALAARADAIVGLLTGNVEAGARLKLQSTGLWPYFRVGAYGSDDADRARLPAIAAARAEALIGVPLPLHRITIIGDTPLDVACARACGATAIAVATGHHTADELEACAPDFLFRDFSDTADALRRLCAPWPSRS
jgi:phosphoglycolate phosphatase